MRGLLFFQFNLILFVGLLARNSDNVMGLSVLQEAILLHHPILLTIESEIFQWSYLGVDAVYKRIDTTQRTSQTILSISYLALSIVMSQ